MKINRKVAMLMAFIMLVPFFWDMNIAVASAATPSFVQPSVEIIGDGETYQLEIKDKVANSKYSWSSADSTIARVSSKGLVTSVNKGTTTIKCKITYPTKKTKTLTCKVTVTIPATEININNANLTNGAHVLRLGESMDFNCDVTPANSSDKAYWFVGGGDASCIRIDNEQEGRITATKAGKAILMVTAARSATQADAALSIVNDAVIIEVVGPTATVKSVDITQTNQITAVFDSPVLQNTVIGANNALSENIELTMSKDTKGVLADDPGKLTASLSSDSKTLTITSEKALSGFYGINFTSSIKTTDGVALEQYYKRISYTDITPPDYIGTTTDDSGLIATINFSEPINFTNMKISSAALVYTNGDIASPATISTLNNSLNYVVSADKKSLSVNLSKISPADYGKLFTVVISGITDMAGNPPANVYLQPVLHTDTAGKPQARILFVRRTGYYTVTATFDRSLAFGGLASIAGGTTITGVVDTTDSKKVNYTISPAEALYTGVKNVQIGFWNSYNVLAADTSANKMYDNYVDFTADTIPPFLVSNKYDADKGILTLTYSEDVTLTANSGIFVSTFTSVVEDIKPNTNISYTKINHTDGNNIIKLQLTGITSVGTYNFMFDQGFVTDNFKNKNAVSSMAISNVSGTLSELPGPYSITQSTTSLSQIVLRFLYKLDKATAENINNYKIAGVTIVKAELSENASDTGATVVLSVLDGGIEYEIERPFTITGVKGYNNSYSPITSFSTAVTLKENKRPAYIPDPVFDKTTKNIVKINFSEAVKGSMTVRCTQINGTYSTEIPNIVTVSGSSATINLSFAPTNFIPLRIDIISNNITDLGGNPVAAMPQTLMTAIVY